MLKEYTYGPWLPDLAPSKGNHLFSAVNVRPIANGYAPVQGFQAITSTLGETFVGGGAFVDSLGNATLLAATPTKLRKYSASWTDLATVASSARWKLIQFGDNVLYANGGPLGAYNLAAGTISTPVDAPTAVDVMRVRDFVAVLRDDNAIQWSQFNDSGTWTMGVNQSDDQPLLGGQGVALVGGEYGIILRKNGIDRMSYVGGEVVFQFDEISAEVGCMAAGSVAYVGKLIFFLSERGFEMCDGQTVSPIGDEKFNRWFFSTYARSEIEGMWSAIDPRNSLVMWAMPASPGRIIAYNWVLQQAAVIEMDVAALFTGFTSNVSLDDIDALYPGGLEAIPISLDDASLAGGNPLLLVVDSNNVIGALAGDNLAGTVALKNVEPTPGKRSRIRALRPVTDALRANATINAKMRAGDGDDSVTAASMRTNGKMPVRANGRYNDIALTIPAGEAWTYLQAVECEFEAGDGR